VSVAVRESVFHFCVVQLVFINAAKNPVNSADNTDKDYAFMKNLQKKALIVVFTFFPLTGLFAANVSFMVLETGAGAFKVDGMANIWEEGFLDAFFNAGHIISNARTVKLDFFPEEELPDAVITDFKEAKEGRSDYFIVVLLNYEAEVNGMTAPESVTMKLYNVTPYKFIFGKTITRKKNGNAEIDKGSNRVLPLNIKQSREEFLDAQKAAQEIIPYIITRRVF